MKKTFIIPMAFVAATSVSIGTGLIANKVITTNNTHTESVVMPDVKVVATSDTKEAPTIKIHEAKNYSSSNVEFIVEYDAKESEIDTTKSEITISATTGGSNPIQTIELNSNPLHVYEFDGLIPKTKYFINATIKTDWDSAETTKAEAVESNEIEITTLALTDTTATTTLTQEKTTIFGKQTGTATVTTTVVPNTTTEPDSIVEVPTITIVDPSGAAADITKVPMVLLGTSMNTYEYDISLLGVNDTRNIIVNIKDNEGGDLTQNELLDGVIKNDELTMPFITTEDTTEDAAEGTSPTEQDDGTLIYKADSLKITIKNHVDAVQIDNSILDSSKAMLGVLDSAEDSAESVDTATTTNVTFAEDIAWISEKTGSTVSLTLNEDLTVSKVDVEAGYTIGMTGLTISGTDTDFNYMFDFDLVEAPSSSTNAGMITGIVIGSIAGVALLGAGGYWLYTNKSA